MIPSFFAEKKGNISSRPMVIVQAVIQFKFICGHRIPDFGDAVLDGLDGMGLVRGVMAVKR